MAMASSSFRPPHPFPSSSQSSLSHDRRLIVRLPRQQLPYNIRATSSVAVESESVSLSTNVLQRDKLACPVCYEPLIRKGPPGLNLESIYRSGFQCGTCNKSYSSKNIYLDLTVTAGSEKYTEIQPTVTELFQSPLVSFLYERGWRQSFSRSGFPGLEEEFNMAQEYFKPAEGGLLVDASCGSGLFSRKFAKSGAYSAVIALDFSENMLRQCYEFTKKEDFTLSKKLALVRADVSRLPFPTASVDAVHAGAALHCWPTPSNAVAEITRILRSGGVFVGSTFLRYRSSSPPIVRLVRELQNRRRSYNYLTEEEIKDLCSTCGLVDYSSKIQDTFIMFTARKP
ncbi:hypothetical protein Dimus_023416 [Dionaea muscipula]